MAANTSKDQPPAYSSQYNQASTTGESAESSKHIFLKPDHSTRASELSQATSEGKYSTLEYLVLIFSVMVFFSDKGERCQPVVLAIDEDYDTLRKDFRRMFVNASTIENAHVFWERSWGMLRHISVIKKDNITAMLRLLKSSIGSDYIRIN